jgi:hypothetical protein
VASRLGQLKVMSLGILAPQQLINGHLSWTNQEASEVILMEVMEWQAGIVWFTVSKV